MEISKFQQLNLLNELAQEKNTFDFLRKKALKRQYDAQRYQRNREQLKRLYEINKHFQKLGLPKPRLVNGVIGGVEKTTLNQKDYNRTYYLKQKQTKLFIADLVSPPPYNQRKDYRKEKQATKIKLRESEKKLTDIYNISKKKGRPRSEEATKLNRALTSTERSRKRRTILKVNQSANKWQRLFLKMLDVPKARLQTNKKVPWKAGRPLNGWKTWNEKETIAKLMEKYGEWGTRTGIKIKYFGRDYYLKWDDNDANKFKAKFSITDELRAVMLDQAKEQNRKMDVAFCEGFGGLGTPILSKEPLTDFNIFNGKHRPSQLLGEGQQAQVQAENKKWNWGKPLIVKNSWGLAQIRNREYKKNGVGYFYEEKNREKISKTISTNTFIYQPAKLQQNYNELLSKYKENEIWEIKGMLNETKGIKAEWKSPTAKPHIALFGGVFFFFDAYYKEQEKLKDYVGQAVKLELKRGKHHIFLNRICQVW